MTDSDRVERWWVVIARGYDGEGVARPGGGVMPVLCVQYTAVYSTEQVISLLRCVQRAAVRVIRPAKCRWS